MKDRYHETIWGYAFGMLRSFRGLRHDRLRGRGRLYAHQGVFDYRRMHAAIDREEDACWWELYDQYLQSEEWVHRRAQRIRHRCEICKSARPHQRHHLTYERVGEEWPEDLLCVCKDCHERLHGREFIATREVPS